MQWTPCNDFQVFDANDEITYTPIGTAPIPKIRAVRRPISHSTARNTERFQMLQAMDVVWHADGQPLRAAVLSEQDMIIDRDQQTYAVVFVERAANSDSVTIVGRKTSSP